MDLTLGFHFPQCCLPNLSLQFVQYRKTPNQNSSPRVAVAAILEEEEEKEEEEEETEKEAILEEEEEEEDSAEIAAPEAALAAASEEKASASAAAVSGPVISSASTSNVFFFISKTSLDVDKVLPIILPHSRTPSRQLASVLDGVNVSGSIVNESDTAITEWVGGKGKGKRKLVYHFWS